MEQVAFLHTFTGKRENWQNFLASHIFIWTTLVRFIFNCFCLEKHNNIWNTIDKLLNVFLGLLLFSRIKLYIYCYVNILCLCTSFLRKKKPGHKFASNIVPYAPVKTKVLEKSFISINQQFESNQKWFGQLSYFSTYNCMEL